MKKISIVLLLCAFAGAVAYASLTRSTKHKQQPVKEKKEKKERKCGQYSACLYKA